MPQIKCKCGGVKTLNTSTKEWICNKCNATFKKPDDKDPIEKAVERKEKSITQAMDRKESSMQKMADQRDMTIAKQTAGQIISALISTGQLNIADWEKEFRKTSRFIHEYDPSTDDGTEDYFINKQPKDLF